MVPVPLSLPATRYVQQLNSTSGAKTVTLTNSGSGSLTITGVVSGGVNADDFSRTGETCAGATLAPGSPYTIALTGEGTAMPTPALSLNATSLDFGNIQVGQASLAQNLTITNTGTGTLTINAAALSETNSGDFQLTGPTCSGATIAPNGTCVIGVIFRHATVGARQASILLLDNAAGAQREVVLTGVGVTGAVGLDTASFDFGNQPVGSQSAAQILTVRNPGLGALKPGPVYVGGAMANEWILLANTCDGATISAGVTCQVGIAFKPTAEGEWGARTSSLCAALVCRRSRVTR